MKKKRSTPARSTRAKRKASRPKSLAEKAAAIEAHRKPVKKSHQKLMSELGEIFREGSGVKTHEVAQVLATQVYRR